MRVKSRFQVEAVGSIERRSASSSAGISGVSKIVALRVLYSAVRRFDREMPLRATAAAADRSPPAAQQTGIGARPARSPHAQTRTRAAIDRCLHPTLLSVPTRGNPTSFTYAESAKSRQGIMQASTSPPTSSSRRSMKVEIRLAPLAIGIEDEPPFTLAQPLLERIEIEAQSLQQIAVLNGRLFDELSCICHDAPPSSSSERTCLCSRPGFELIPSRS